jgi:polyisoprenoid-binding protein YceI
VAVAIGRYELGPDDASLQVKTYREGVAAKVGHDLVIAVTRWEATVEIADDPAASTIELSADARSLEVREGVRGVKPLTDKDRAEIVRNIDEKILRGQPIAFRSTSVRLAHGGGSLTVDGELTIVGNARPMTVELTVGADGQLSAAIPLIQSAWGIKPYRGLMGALRVRDEIEIAIEARVPPRDR